MSDIAVLRKRFRDYVIADVHGETEAEITEEVDKALAMLEDLLEAATPLIEAAALWDRIPDNGVELFLSPLVHIAGPASLNIENFRRLRAAVQGH